MALISAENQKLLEEKFWTDLVDPVHLVCFTQQESAAVAPGQERRYYKETQQLLEELVAISSKLSLTVYDFVADAGKARELGVDKAPAIIVDGGAGDRVRFFGIPAGNEFSSLIQDIIDISQHSTKLSENTKEALQSMENDVYIQVFVTPT